MHEGREIVDIPVIVGVLQNHLLELSIGILIVLEDQVVNCKEDLGAFIELVTILLVVAHQDR